VTSGVGVVWCGAAGFFLSDLHLRLGGLDPLGHSAATPPAGLCGRGRLPPSSSSFFDGAASLGWGRSTLSRTGSASASTMALYLLHLPVSVGSLKVKSPTNPLCFHSRVSCCPILILICLCGMFVWVHDACVVAMNVDFEH
jgi:hypothetical protein